MKENSFSFSIHLHLPERFEADKEFLD